MFKFEQKRYTYDIGNQQTTPDSTYPLPDNETYGIKKSEEFVKEGDDISGVTKDTLSTYLKRYSRGKTENLDIHPNDFPIGLEGGLRADEDLKLTDDAGFPAKFTPPTTDQKVFARNTNADGLKTDFFDFGIKSIEETGFRKGLDSLGQYNGNSLLNDEKNTKFVETRYTNSLLANNRFTSSKKFSNKFLSENVEEPNVNFLTETNTGTTELGFTKNEFKNLSMENLSVIGTKLLEKNYMGIANTFRSIGSSFKIDAENLDINKIINDNIKNSDEFEKEEYKADESFINNATYGNNYSDKNIFGETNLDLNLSNVVIKTVFTLIVAAGSYLVLKLEDVLEDVKEKKGVQGKGIPGTSRETLIGNFEEIKNQFINATNKDLTEDLSKFNETTVEGFLLKGWKVYAGIDPFTLNAQIHHKNSKQILFSILHDLFDKTNKAIKLVQNNSSLVNSLNIALQIGKYYFDSKLRKFTEVLVYLGMIHQHAFARSTFDKERNEHTIDKSREAGFGQNGNVKKGIHGYKYDNNLPGSRLIPDEFLSPIDPDTTMSALSDFSSQFTKINDSPTKDGKAVDKLFEKFADKYGEDYVPFYFFDSRTNEVISFHAFIDQLNDQFSVNYDSIESMGRIEPVRLYKDTQRKIEVGFTIFASNDADFDLMWFKVNKLLTLIYPQFTSGREIEIDENGKKVKSKIPFSQVHYGTPIIRLRVGDYIKGNYADSNLDRLFTNNDDGFLSQKEIDKSPIFLNYQKASQGLAGVIENFNFDIQTTTWETTPGRQAPKLLKISFGFQPIHDITPGLDHNGFNRAPIYKIGEMNKQIFKLEERYVGLASQPEESTTPATTPAPAPAPAPTTTNPWDYSYSIYSSQLLTLDQEDAKILLPTEDMISILTKESINSKKYEILVELLAFSVILYGKKIKTKEKNRRVIAYIKKNINNIGLAYFNTNEKPAQPTGWIRLDHILYHLILKERQAKKGKKK